jgi:hypothetical protein
VHERGDCFFYLFHRRFFPQGSVAQDAGDQRGVHGVSGTVGDYVA